MGINDHQPDKKRPAKKGTGKAARFNDVKFINRELTTDEQKTLKAQPFEPQTGWDQIDALTESYRVTLKFDDYSGAYSASLTPLSEQNENWGYILTGRGSTALKALKQVLFKHHVLCGDKPWRVLDPDRPDMQIDD